MITGLNLAVGGLLLMTAAALLWRPLQPGSLIAALALTTLPFTSGSFWECRSDDLSGSPDRAIERLVTILGHRRWLALLALLFLFPDGRFYPARLRVPAAIGLLLTIAGITATFWIDNGWWLFIVGLLGVILLAVGGQIRRYRGRGCNDDRRPVLWRPSPPHRSGSC